MPHKCTGSNQQMGETLCFEVQDDVYTCGVLASVTISVPACAGAAMQDEK